MDYDFLVVGQGIAGSVISSLLYKKGKSFLVLDNNWNGSASKVAAGLYNPIVFKRIVKSWKVDDLLPAMDDYYGMMEKMLNTSFYHKKDILKVFVNEEERDQWFKRASDPAYERYLSKEAVYFPEDTINYNCGGAKVKQAGNLDTLTFITLWKQFLEERSLLLRGHMNFEQFELSESSVTYKGITFQKVIFCEGHQAIHNPFFKYLPFVLTKGDLLTVNIPNLSTEYIINKSVFVLPLKNNFRVGSTYQWNYGDDKPALPQKLEIEEKLKNLVRTPFETIEHTAGIRPTVKDRRPFLGLHPKYKQLSIFNGLGTKGVMLAPYFAEHLLEFILHNQPLDIEVDIARFHYNDV